MCASSSPRIEGRRDSGELDRLRRRIAGLECQLDRIDGIGWKAVPSSFAIGCDSRRAERLMGYPLEPSMSRSPFRVEAGEFGDG